MINNNTNNNNNNNPDKVIVYYDTLSDSFLIRLVDTNFKDIAKYDELPAMCRISDLYVDSIPIGDLIVGSNFYFINDKYIFSTDNDNNIISISDRTGRDTSDVGIGEISEVIKDIFNIRISA